MRRAATSDHLYAEMTASFSNARTEAGVIASRISAARRFNHDMPAMPATAPETNQNNRLNIGVTVVPESVVANGPECPGVRTDGGNLARATLPYIGDGGPHGGRDGPALRG